MISVVTNFFISSQKVLVKEFGAKWRDLLLEFDMKPFAAASIGQVHRGVLKDGRPVAIKIQVFIFFRRRSKVTHALIKLFVRCTFFWRDNNYLHLK